ncbi:MAG: hypothetical protein IJ003_05045 [Candidatus Gastranaerophilales bacterium]|nr:hypothetical protein [Candidatus Gastranaerophilales bacterium]
MRISTSAMTNMTTNSMSNANSVYADILQKITSGKNFSKMSENPTDATKVLKLKDQLAQLEGFQSNIQAAMNEMNLAWDTLNAVSDELNSINSLVLEGANATTTPSSAKALATEIDQRVATIMDKMNAKYLDNYIFAGTYTQDMAYVTDTDGNIVYQGSSEKAGDRNLTVAEGKTFTYNFTGEEIFGKQDGVNDFFAQMKELSELLNADTLDYEAIREKIGVIAQAQDKITQTNGKVSAYVTKLDTEHQNNTDTILNLTEDRVDLEEVDITKAASDLANAQTALQASYLVGTRVLGSVSLLDYI